MRAFAVLLLLALGGCVTKGPISPVENLGKEPTLHVADAALASGNPLIALNIANELLRERPDNVSALIHKGEALYALGRSNEAMATYRQALALRPGSVEAKIGLGRLMLTSNPGEAEAIFLGVVERHPRDAVALNNLGIAEDLQGRYQQAQRTYSRALAVQPGMAAAQVNMGLSLALGGDPQRAITILRPIADGAQSTPRVRHDLAVALALAGHAEEATRVLSTDMRPHEAAAAVAGFRNLAR
jgi:Flp pilus assembly protein TadD